jgi:hypothetical protein
MAMRAGRAHCVVQVINTHGAAPWLRVMRQPALRRVVIPARIFAGGGARYGGRPAEMK